MSTENGDKHKHQVDGTSHPVVDIEELDKELRLRSRNRKMQREQSKKDSKDSLKKSELRDLLNSVSESNVVALCTCQQSKDFPYCDNTHTIFNKATNSHLSPLYVAFVEGKGVCNDCGSKLKKSQDNSTAPESPGCSITLSDCTNTDSSILDTDTPATSTSSTSTSNSPTLALRRRSIRKSTSTETSPTCQCSTTSTTPSHSTNASSTSHNMDTTSRDLTTRDTPSTDITSTSTTSSSVSREESVDLTLPHSSDPEEDEDQTTTTTTTSTLTTTKGKEESTTITTPPVILATSNATTRDEESEKEVITTVKYIPSSIKDPRNRDNIISKYEVSQHNTQTDLWMIIKGNVYDITNYVKSHPGGVRALVKFAGRDGTENVQYHSSAMLEILNSRYFIGRLPKEEGGPGGGCIIC